MTGHNNWITVGEIIRLIQKPVALYTSHIVKTWHAKLQVCCLRFGRCTTAADCQTKKKPRDLCTSCQGWFDELAKSHRNSDKGLIKWRKNCDTSKWPGDPWEVAKFFMSILGDSKITVKDGESTDLSSLLNVLTCMEDVVFAPDIRVNLDLVEKLRSEVRNPWAHAPNQELTEPDLNDAFVIANKFVADLNNVFSCDEVIKCIKDIKDLQDNGLTNVKETKLKILDLLSVELGGEVGNLKEETNHLEQEIKRLEQNRSSDRQVILEMKENLENFEKQIKSLQDIVNVQGTDGRCQLKSCIPDNPPIFIGRDAKVNEIISSLVKNECGIVSVVGGPGFGKSTVAVKVSHHLSNDHDIVVIFSFLSTASTVPEVIARLCHDVGVNPGEDPESALMLWVKNIETKVVLVMDNVEQMLESSVKSQFTEFVVTLRKNSRQHLQILTTTRTGFSIPGQTTENHQILELDEISSVELLRQCCPDDEVENAYLSKLAELCGFVPLALCIAGTLIPDLDDPSELIQWLEEKPMETLRNPNQCVQQAIEFSFKMLSDEDKKALVRLSVFDGNFRRDSAKEVIERNGLKTQNFLSNLLNRSLIQRSSDKRFVIHSLIRQFLADHDQLQLEKAMAQGLMVRHFLKLCHSLTMDSYSCNGFTSARESLKRDVHNVQETLKICSQDQATDLNPAILEFLASCDVYKSSSKFFYKFSYDLLPRTVSRNFFESCIKLAEIRKEPLIQIAFQCLVADQEGRKSAWKSNDYINRMEGINEMFQKNKAVLKEDRFLFMYCYYFYARYNSSKATNNPPLPDLSKDDLAPLPENRALSCIEKAAETYVLIERGHLNKKRASKMYHTDGQEKYEEYMNCAKSCFSEALMIAKELLGDHELTCTLHKQLGDVCLTWRKNEEALTYYSDALKLRKKLKLDSNEHFVLLLKNYGACLSFLRRFDESVEKLKEGLDIADKLAEKHTLCRAKMYYELARACNFWKPDCQEAVLYAKEALEMQDLLDKRDVAKLEKIIETVAEIIA